VLLYFVVAVVVAVANRAIRQSNWTLTLFFSQNCMTYNLLLHFWKKGRTAFVTINANCSEVHPVLSITVSDGNTYLCFQHVVWKHMKALLVLLYQLWTISVIN
jgi:hypothetical protein